MSPSSRLEKPLAAASPSSPPKGKPDPEKLAKLIDLIAGGDRIAFKALYDATSPKLFGVAMRLLRSRDRAEDVAQEAYLRIWSSARTFDSELGAPMPWLVTILRNVALDRLSKDRMVGEDIADYEEQLAAPIPLDGAKLDAIRCLAKLTAHQRDAVVMTYVHGYTNEEIAASMRVPIGTVKSWIRRGAERMREQFTD